MARRLLQRMSMLGSSWAQPDNAIRPPPRLRARPVRICVVVCRQMDIFATDGMGNTLVPAYNLFDSQERTTLLASR